MFLNRIVHHDNFYVRLKLLFKEAYIFVALQLYALLIQRHGLNVIAQRY